jgi:hypothetical protein
MVMIPLYKFGVPASTRKALSSLMNHKLLQVEAQVIPEMRRAMLDYMEDTVLQTIATTKIKQRSGRLFKSLREGSRVKGTTINSLEGTYFSNEYAYKHEYGAIITPTVAQVLTLPLDAALRADGTPKLKGPKSWRRFGTFSYTSKKTGRGYLAYKNAKGELVLLYVFVDRVKINAQLGLRKNHNASLGELVRAWGDIIVEGMHSIDLMDVIANPKKKQPFRVSTVRRLVRPKRI